MSSRADSPVFRVGSLSSRPAAASVRAGDVHLATDAYGGRQSVSDGSSWVNAAPAVDDPRLAGGNATPLKRFRQALATVEATPLVWLACGDSITEGSGATRIDRTWIHVVRSELQKEWTTAGTGGFGYLSTYARTNPSLNGAGSGVNYWTFGGGGTLTPAATAFLGRRRYVGVANETATLTFTGTDVDIHYNQAVAADSFTVAVDGGGGTLVTPNGTANRQGRYQINALSAGPHTVLITPSSGRVLPIDGATIYNGDRTNGIRVLNNAEFGITAVNYIATSGAGASGAVARLTDPLAVFPNPALVTIHIGTNDMISNTPTVVASSVTTLIANVKSLCTITPSFLLIVPSQRAATLLTGFTMADYRAAITGVADADATNVALLDLSRHFIDVPTVENNYVRGLINSDGTHPTDGGYRFIAQLVLRALLADTRPAVWA